MGFSNIRGYGGFSLRFMIEARLPNATIPLKETRAYEINMVGTPNGTGSPFHDLNQRYHWIIEGVTLHIAGLQEEVKCHGEGYTNKETRSAQMSP